MMKKWKRRFVNGWECENLISSMGEILTRANMLRDYAEN
jgi:hypothetical protein